uniref:Uncharacterized protein n=1 Tax=Tanacetum cinerariifolium TaxID=118510 RepID=A0A699KNM6_TANCI|nr:hypothetical protein [Tanacetum cinerariifolium]
MQTNQFAEAVSLIPDIVDKYIDHRMNEAVKVVVRLQSDRLQNEAQAKNEDFLNKLDENIQKIINEQVKISYTIAVDLSELELKKILIEKMESNKRQDDEDKDEEPSAGSNRGSKRRREGKEPESTSAPKEKKSKTSGKPTEGSKSQHKIASESAPAEEPTHSTQDLEEPVPQEFLRQVQLTINLLKRPLSILTGFRNKQNRQLLVVLGTRLYRLLMDVFSLRSAIWQRKLTLALRLMS